MRYPILMWEVLMDLKNIINKNWDKSNFISLSLDKSKVKLITDATYFLDEIYEKVPLRTRAYVIKNNIIEDTLPKCICGNSVAINKTYPELGFRQYCGPKCSRSDKTIDKNIIEVLDNYEFLYDEKIIKQKSIEQIAKEHNISTIPVVKYLKKHNLYQLNDARKLKPEILENLKNKNLLYEYYINQNKTLKEISKILECGTGSIIKSLKEHDINIKSRNYYGNNVKKCSNEETRLCNYIKSIEKSSIEQNNRKLFNGKEIDILIPSKLIAIEYNGLYSHLYRPNEKTKSRIKNKTYHLNKTLEAKSLGINLYHIFSSEWNSESESIKNFLKRKLHLNDIIDISNTSKIFISKKLNLITLSLIYNNNIVSKLVYKDNKTNISIVSYKVKSNITLKGGFNMVLNFLHSIHKKPIYCKINRRFSEGNLFTSYGFKVVRVIEPKLLYTDNSYDKLYNNFAKNKKYYGIYDCGYLILKYK